MPKLKQSDYDRRCKSVKSAIKYGMSQQDLTAEKIAKILGKDRVTFYRKMCHPEKITLAELWLISAAVHIPAEKLMKGEVE